MQVIIKLNIIKQQLKAKSLFDKKITNTLLNAIEAINGDKSANDPVDGSG